MEFEPGKLYAADPHFFILIYPSREKAQEALVGVGATDVSAADYWSKEFKCQVKWMKPGSAFMVLFLAFQCAPDIRLFTVFLETLTGGSSVRIGLNSSLFNIV